MICFIDINLLLRIYSPYIETIPLSLHSFAQRFIYLPWFPFQVAAMIFGIAIFFTNLIVVAAIHRGGRKLHKATFYCICNLALADMLAGLLLLWIFGLQRVSFFVQRFI